MARKFISGFGPAHTTDLLAYLFSDSSTGYSFVGGYLQADSTAGALAVTRNVDVTEDTYVWAVGTGRVTGVFTSGQAIWYLNLSDSLGNTLDIELQQNGGDLNKFRFRLNDISNTVNIGTGTGLYDVGTDFTWRFQTDGSRWKLWINGVLEIDVAKTKKIDCSKFKAFSHFTTRKRRFGK